MFASIITVSIFVKAFTTARTEGRGGKYTSEISWFFYFFRVRFTVRGTLVHCCVGTPNEERRKTPVTEKVACQ